MVALLRSDKLDTSHSILCVDDEPQILEALALTLGRQHQIEMAPSGKAALDILREMPRTAVIISDMRMPSMNGAQFLAASRKIAPNARRILLTGYADTASAILAVNEGGIFELTETVFAEDFDRVCKLLSEVRLLGVSVAIDDFGAGYSSLAYLAHLPVDVLKIDRTFEQDIDRGGGAIIGAALSVAHTLKIEVIVEGIETALELERVRALGATKIQGFFFARAVPVASLLSWREKFDNPRGAA